MSLKSSFIPSLSDVQRYLHLRGLARDLNHRIHQDDCQDGVVRGRRIHRILHRGVLVFNSEDETHIQMEGT